MGMLFLACRRYKDLVLLCVLVFFMPSNCNGLGKERPFGFSYDGFGMNVSLVSEIALHGDAVVSGSVVKLTRPRNSSNGLMVYKEPIRFFGTKSGFTTYLSFSLGTGNGGRVMFFLVPKSVQLESNPMLSSAISIELMLPNTKGSESLIGFRVGKHHMIKRYNLSATKSNPNYGERLNSWIDYDGAVKRLEVRFSKSKDLRPANASMTVSIDLSNILWKEAMLAGLSSYNKNYNQACTIYSWHFAVKHGAPYRMHSDPLNPDAFLLHSHESVPVGHKRTSYPWGMILAMLFAAACGALIAFFLMFVWIALVARRRIAPVEYPVHPVDVVYEKIVLVGTKEVDSAKKINSSGP